MAVFTMTDAKVLMPRTIADGMVKASKSASVIAKLSPREPMRFGDVDIITFNDFPKAEFVEPGAPKSSTKGTFGVVTAEPHKAQVTMRFHEEVQWADEDHQLGIIRELGDAGGIALSRGLDLGLIHRINPLPGTVMANVTSYMTSTTKRVEQKDTVDADAEIREAVGLLVKDGKSATGLALDPKLSWELASLQNLSGGVPNGQPRYPDLGFGTNVSSFMGLSVAQGDTVSGTPEALDTKIRGIVGDFVNGVRWGVQRNLPIEIIRYGDPDGQGDLKRTNSIALRLEIVYGWYVFADRFAVIEDVTAG